jgi:hypothetical protein
VRTKGSVRSGKQKIGQFSFAFSKRGFNLRKCFDRSYQKDFSLIKVSIRGVGDEELIFVDKEEFDALPDQEKKVMAT